MTILVLVQHGFWTRQVAWIFLIFLDPLFTTYLRPISCLFIYISYRCTFQVTVEDPKTGDTVEFPCQRWFSTSEDDGQITRELTIAGKTCFHNQKQLKMSPCVLSIFYLAKTFRPSYQSVFCEDCPANFMRKFNLAKGI